jgi:zinc protease
MQVLLQENRAAPVVALQVWVNVGSADEGPGEEGLAHVFEHMLFKGTERRGVGELAADVEAAGGDINAWTSFDQTVYHLVLSSREKEKGVEILADALLRSTFDPEELERERGVILEEMKRSKDSPTRVLSQELFSLAYQAHPYKRPVLGYETVIKSLTRDTLVKFHQRWYTPENMIFVGVGDFDAEALYAEVEREFGGAAQKPTPKATHPKEPTPSAPRHKAIVDAVQEAHFELAFPIPEIAHEDVPALDLLALVLGQGESSRLTLEVKRTKQLVNDVYAYTYTPKDPGLFVLSGSATPEHLFEAIKSSLNEAYRLHQERVPQAELEKARALIESDSIFLKETVQGQARRLGFFAQVVGDLDFEARYQANIAKATPEDLRRVARKYLAPERLSAAILVPTSPEVLADESRAAARRGELEAALSRDTEEAFAHTLPQKGSVGTVKDHQLVREVLDNGTILLVERAPEVPVVALRAVSIGGLLLENDENNGISSLIARMLTKGTPTHSAHDIAREFDEMAGSIGGFAGRNSLGMRAEFLSKHFERGFSLFADCLLESTFDTAELENERRHTLEDIKNRDDNPAGEAFRIFSQALYTTHPYRLDLDGTLESVRLLSQHQLQEFYEKNYPAQRLVVSIVGDVDPDQALALGRRLFGDRPRQDGFRAPQPPVEAPKEKSQTQVKNLDKAQAHVVLGFLGTTLSDPDRYPLEVLNTILSGQGGRLFLELRDKRSLAYSVSASILDGLSKGHVAVYIGTSPERVKEAIDGIVEVLTPLTLAEVPEKDLARAKRYLLGAHDISLQRSSAIASVLAFHEAYGLGALSYKDYPAKIETITAADVLRVAKKYLTLDRYTLSIVQPAK